MTPIDKIKPLAGDGVCGLAGVPDASCNFLFIYDENSGNWRCCRCNNNLGGAGAQRREGRVGSNRTGGGQGRERGNDDAF